MGLVASKETAAFDSCQLITGDRARLVFLVKPKVLIFMETFLTK